MSANQHPPEQSLTGSCPDCQQTTDPTFAETAVWPPLLGVLADQLTADSRRLALIYPAPPCNLATATAAAPAKTDLAGGSEVNHPLQPAMHAEPSFPPVPAVMVHPREHHSASLGSRRWPWFAAASVALIPAAGMLWVGWQTGGMENIANFGGHWSAPVEISHSFPPPAPSEIANPQPQTATIMATSSASLPPINENLPLPSGAEPVSFHPPGRTGHDHIPTHTPPTRVFQSLSAPQREAFLDLLEAQALQLDSLSI
ncbi:MAG: hypothetical protein SFX18_04770 [Pirellulales bacterium]|nr:hypothetical protein [Pirellulales bacterium]